MGHLSQDIRYSFRTLLAQPAFALVAIVVLALGIGANTAVFSAVNAIVLRPLPFDQADRLFMVRETRANADFARAVVAPGEFVQWTERRDLFDSLTAVDYPAVTVAANGGDGESLSALLAPVSLFQVLRLNMTSGRPISAEEDRPGQPLAVVISWDYWQRQFSGDTRAIGASIRVDARPATIVGILPRGFAFNGPVDIILPAQYSAADAATFDHHFLDVVGRLQAGVTRERAEAALSSFVNEHQQTPPHANGAALIPLQEVIVGASGSLAWLLLGAIGCVLAIACANIASLLLARATTRRREMAIRAALGAGRARIVSQLLIESVLLSTIAGTLGVLLSLWGVDLLIALSPAGTPRLSEIRVDAYVLAFAAGLTLFTGLAFGLAPAFHAARVDVNDTLKLEGRSGAASRPRALNALTIAEIAVALMLLVGAALLLGSFQRLNAVDPGFNADQVIAVNVAPPERAYPDPPRQAALYARLLDRVSQIPGVASAAIVNVLPLSGNNASGGFSIEGRPAPPPQSRLNANIRRVTPAYFSTMGISLVRGRGLEASDAAGAPSVVVINQTMGTKFWPNEDPIGKRIKLGRLESNAPWITIVGISGDVRHGSLRADARQEMYFPFAQQPSRTMVLTVRTEGDPRALFAPVRQAVHEVDADLPGDGIQVMRDIQAASLQADRFSTSLVGAFAAIALLLALIGIYGLMSFGVSMRRREIGVRMALGAGRGDVVALVLRQALQLVAAGVCGGLLAAVALSRALGTMLYGLSPIDVPTYTAVALALITTAAVASLVPAYRATRIDPLAALRD